MRFIFLISSFFVSASLAGQFFDDFSDGNIETNPPWLGDIDDFLVNEEFKLQLNANEAGSSYLYSEYKSLDSFEFTIDYEMDFNPSGSNFLRLYFSLDNIDINLANGFFLQLGENGSDDAVELYQLTNGSASLLERGINSNLANDPSLGKIKIVSRNDGQYTLAIDYNNQGIFVSEFNWSSPTSGGNINYLGIYTEYTSTRVDKFIFDNISIAEYIPDLLPPTLEDLIVINDSEIQLIFSEPVDENSVSPLNIMIDNNIGMALTAIVNNSIPNQVNATFAEQFNGGPTYQVTINDIQDLAGNKTTSITKSFQFAETANEGDLLLSEILFDPYSQGSDFFELYNNTNKLLSTEGLKILNQSKGEEKEIPTVQILPGQYVAFTEDIDQIIQTYNPIISEGSLVSMDLPSFNNDSGNFTLTKDDEEWSESFDYEEEFHNTLLDDTEGVSLERLSFNSAVNTPDNWFSSSSANLFATPGYQNSNRISLNINEGVNLESTKFSPNGDGNQDEMRLIYKLDKPEGVLNLDIYSSNGFKIRTLASSKPVGTEGVIIWDGTNGDGRLENLGIYILNGNILFPDGDIIKIKQVVSLVDFIK